MGFKEQHPEKESQLDNNDWHTEVETASLLKNDEETLQNSWKTDNKDELDDSQQHSETVPLVQNAAESSVVINQENVLKNISLKKHAASHTTEKLLHCNYCNKDFHRNANFKRHLETVHSCTKSFACITSSKVFKQRMTLTEHLKSHSQDVKNNCQICRKIFRTAKTLNGLLDEHFETKTFECKICNKVFKTKRKLGIHKKDVHLLSFSCSECGKKFGRNQYLKVHFRKHTNEKPFECHLCPKTYATPQSVKVHLRTHSKEKPHICPICKKAFAHVSNMTRHVKLVHNKEKLHKYSVCSNNVNTPTVAKKTQKLRSFQRNLTNKLAMF